MISWLWQTRVKIAVLSAQLMICACAHSPHNDDFKSPIEEPVGASGTAVPPSTQTAAYPEPPVPPVAQTASAALDTASATPINQNQQPDLFNRIRGGMQLDEVSRNAITQQLNFYAANPDYLERSFGRAELYLYHIVTELEARGMPLELALLPVVESAFEPFAYSRARASGLWQFIPATGSHFGLKQNWWYDGRRDVVESTRAALDYLQYMHKLFQGDWLLAIAGYNCGESNVLRAIKRNRSAGRPTDFWSLTLPKETRAYVPKLLAMKRLVANPEDYGLEFSAIPNQPYFERVATLGQIDLKLAAEIAGVTPEELFELNPAFHRWATDPAGPHFLLLPNENAAVFRENISQLTPDQRLSVSLYTVQEGDSVASVARQFDTSIEALRELNGLPSGVLTVGSSLKIPSAKITLPPKVARAAARVDQYERRAAKRPHVHVVVKRGDSLWRIAKRNGMDVKTLAKLNGLNTSATLRAGQKLRVSSGNSSSGSSNSSAPSSGRKVSYKVRRGDTLSQIARLFQVTVSQLSNWNNITSRTILRPGQKLTIIVAGRRG
jgi:membrane-bound lytic murein transglycosylase D